VVAVAAASGLVGCGPQHAAADDPPLGTSSSSASPTPTPAPSPSSIYAAPADAYVKPSRPASLDGPPSEDAAIDFAKYYLRLYTYAYLTGDAADLNALGEPGCIFCQNVAKDIAREYGSGGRDEGGVMTIDSAQAHDYGSGGFFGVSAGGRQAPNRELGSRGEAVKETGMEKEFDFNFAMYWTANDGWRLGDLGVTPK
jgi:hypothetical protein